MGNILIRWAEPDARMCVQGHGPVLRLALSRHWPRLWCRPKRDLKTAVSWSRGKRILVLPHMYHDGRGSEEMHFQTAGLNIFCRIWFFNIWLLSALQHFSLGCKFPLAQQMWQVSIQNKGYGQGMAAKPKCCILGCRFPNSSSCRSDYLNAGHFTGTGFITFCAKFEVILTVLLRFLCWVIWKIGSSLRTSPALPCMF